MIIATGCQVRWKDSYAPSEVVKLTIRANGEEKTQVITPYGEMVQAGFDAPTVDPTLLVSAGGSLAQDTWYAYRYVYASSNYPFVQNAVTIDGNLWPRSNPSGYDVDVTTAANKTITVTMTKTTRSDVDKIVVYRTEGHTSQSLAEAAAEAGEMFFIDYVSNNGIAGTTTLVDNGITATTEILEADNYTADTFWFSVFDGKYWWGIGNPEFTTPVTLDGTNVITQSGPYSWFDGRDGQAITFDGINSGGSDQRGTFYFKWLDATTGSVFTDQALTQAASLPFTGTTVAHIQGASSTLFRSKAYNPFSWGFTQTLVNDDATTTNIPQSFALQVAGGAATAIAVAGNPRKLKLDFENPPKCITLDLQLAESDQFGDSAQDIDQTGSVTSHHCQFHGFVGESPVLMGIDTANGNIVAFTGTSHQVISDRLGDLLLSLDRSDNAHRFYCGAYDPETECNFFFVRLYNTEPTLNVAIWMHAPTQEWGWYPLFGISAVCPLLDSDENQRYVLGGTENGNIGQMYDPDSNVEWTGNLPWKNNLRIVDTTLDASQFVLSLPYELLTSPSKYSQALASYNGTLSTFTTTSTPLFSVGETLALYGSDQSMQFVTPSIIDGNVVTTDATFSNSVVSEYVMVSGPRIDGSWAVIQNPDGLDEWFVHIGTMETDSEHETFEITITEYIQRGSLEVLTPSGTAPWRDGSRIVFGCVPCYWRTYFDLGTPTRNKKNVEMWVTAGSVEQAEQESPNSLADTLTGRYYTEFDEDSDSRHTFMLKVDRRPNGVVDSFTWGSKTRVPSTSVPQFGMEIGEIGTGPFTLYNATLKLNVD